MPIAALALLSVFTLIALASGIGAWRAIDPRRRWGAIIPAGAAFGALYVVGHRLGWTFGPEVNLFGFDVALPWEILLAIVTATAVAWLQRAVADRLRS
jgi:hypothetical protein